MNHHPSLVADNIDLSKVPTAALDLTGTGITQPERPRRQRLIETTSAERKQYPLATGLLDYFPDALAEVAQLSYQATQQHHPDKPMHHDRDKSNDHADCIIRHLQGRGGFDGKTRESAALAWRALALLQEELEAEYGLALPRAAYSAKAGKPAP